MSLADFLKKHFDLSQKMPAPKGMAEDAREMCLSDMIPYTVHYDDETVITKDNGLVQVIKIDGLYFDSLEDAQVRQFERSRNTVLRAIANSNRGIYVHLVRRRIKAYPEGEGPAWFARTLNAAWKARCEQQSFYVNDIYISIVRNRFRQGVPGMMDRLMTTLSGIRLSREEQESLEQQARDMYEAGNLLLQALSPYGARRLRIQRKPHWEGKLVRAVHVRETLKRMGLRWDDFIVRHGEHPHYPVAQVQDYLGEDISEISAFLHYLVNLEEARVPLMQQPLHGSLAASVVECNTVGDVLSLENGQAKRACAVLSMAEWPARTSSKMLDELLRQPVEFVLTQSFFFTDRISAEHDMRQERRRLVINDTAGEEDAQEITQGLQALASGRSVNGLHHLSVLVHVAQDNGMTNSETLAALDAAVALMKKSFISLGVRPVREWFAAESFFWSQLPGQAQHFMGRRGLISSANFAGFASLHNYAIGKLDNNLWGPAIMPFQTESGTAYYFNFHREMEGMVAGHTTFTADTGAGKTTLLAMLIAMADKARPRVFWFDNREGAKVFMRAMGGQHTTLTLQGNTGWNPFRLPDTAENRAYLVDLLVLMRTCYGGVLVPEDMERFKKAVAENYGLPEEDRRLRNIVWCFGQGELARDMRVWHGANGQAGAHAGVFDNAVDSMDLSACRYYCYEMRQLMRDGAARPELPVVLSYPFHRIEQSMNGEPFILVLEEGQNLVRHAYWREKIDSYIMQIRRKNGLLVFVTPDAKYLYCETDSIQKQAVTKIFLPNSEASYEDYVTALGLTEQEYVFIRDTPPERRRFLIRRGNESVRAVFDLADMAHFIPVLSSNDKGVALMESIIAEVGTDAPEVWVPVFMHRAAHMNTHNLQAKDVS